MTLAAKGVAATGVGAVVLVGGYGVAQYVNGEPHKEPLESGAAGYESTKFVGSKHSSFVDPDNAKNKTWWDWAYENRLKSKKPISGVFSAVAEGFKDSTSTTHLNQVCKTVLQREKTEFVNQEERERVWEFCSMNGEVPEAAKQTPTPGKLVKSLEDTAKQTTPYNVTSKLGGIIENHSKLVADDEGNKEWFKWIYENKLKKEQDKTTDKDLSIEFDKAKVTTDYDGSVATALNKVCASIHGKSLSEFSADQNSEADKFKIKRDTERFCTKPGETLSISGSAFV